MIIEFKNIKINLLKPLFFSVLVGFICSLTACTASESYHHADELGYYDEVDDNDTVAYTTAIDLPFIRKNKIEVELTHLINSYQEGSGGCRMAEVTKSPVLSKDALTKLSKNSQQYWEKVLPEDTSEKQALLAGVERNLDAHMATLEQTITATGLNISEKNGRIILSALNSVPAPTTAPIQLAQRHGSTPIPVLKAQARFASVPVPQFRQQIAAVPVKRPTINLGEGGPYIPYGHSLKERYINISQNLLQLATLSQIRQALPIGVPLSNALITSPFGMRRDPFNWRSAFHSGVDLSSEGKPPIHATARGVVVFAGWRNGYGNTVIINHGLGLTTRYGHMSQIRVRPGQRIRDREVIGYQGSTGRSTGNHVHYEIRLNNTPIDPSRFIEAGEQQACSSAQHI